MANKDDCIFCKIVKGKIDTEIIYENGNFIAFPDANQKVEGHTLIVSKDHFVNAMDVPSSLGQELLDAIKNVGEKKIKEGAEGFNIIQNNFPAAGQVVMHIHYHLMPRKKGDDFKVSL